MAFLFLKTEYIQDKNEVRLALGRCSFLKEELK